MTDSQENDIRKKCIRACQELAALFEPAVCCEPVSNVIWELKLKSVMTETHGLSLNYVKKFFSYFFFIPPLDLWQDPSLSYHSSPFQNKMVADQKELP